MRTQLENDLLDAQSRIEDLEKLLKTQGKVRHTRCFQDRKLYATAIVPDLLYTRTFRVLHSAIML